LGPSREREGKPWRRGARGKSAGTARAGLGPSREREGEPWRRGARGKSAGTARAGLGPSREREGKPGVEARGERFSWRVSFPGIPPGLGRGLPSWGGPFLSNALPPFPPGSAKRVCERPRRSTVGALARARGEIMLGKKKPAGTARVQLQPSRKREGKPVEGRGNRVCGRPFPGNHEADVPVPREDRSFPRPSAASLAALNTAASHAALKRHRPEPRIRTAFARTRGGSSARRSTCARLRFRCIGPGSRTS